MAEGGGPLPYFGAVRLATIRTDTGNGTAAVRSTTTAWSRSDRPTSGRCCSCPTGATAPPPPRVRRRPLPADHKPDLAPLIPRPDKIVCVGLNYRNHIAEMGHEPRAPDPVRQVPPALIGANDDIVLPAVSDKVDWEAELAVVIGTPVRHAAADGGRGRHRRLRGAQRRERARLAAPHAEWLQGKTFESTTPLGP